MKKPSLMTLKKYLVYSYLPVQMVLPSTTLAAQFSMPFSKPKPAVLPITGSQSPAKDNAEVIGEQVSAPKQWPVTGGNITTKFASYHPGIDIAIATGTPIKPILPGVVVEAAYDGSGYGQNIVVLHGNGLTTRYAHLSKMNVTAGQTVLLSTVLGNVGSTGHSTGPHLHFELYKDGNAVDPLAMLP